MNVPWAKSRESKTSIVARAEGCTLAVRLLASEDPHRTMSHSEISEKMQNVYDQELDILSQSPEAWVSSKLGAFGSTIFSKVMSGVDFSAERLRCIVLLPTEFKNDMLVTININALDIDDESTWENQAVPEPSSASSDSGNSTLDEINGTNDDTDDGIFKGRGYSLTRRDHKEVKDVSIRGLDISVGQDLVDSRNISGTGEVYIRALLNMLKPQDVS